MSTATLQNEKTKTSVPQLRFPEFEEGWEKQKFNNYVHSISSGKIKPNDDGEFLVYGSTGVIGKSNTFSHNGDYILVARVGANAGQINRAKGKYGVTDNTLVIDLKKYVSIAFCELFLRKFNLNKLIFGSGQPLITGGLLKSIDFIFPTLPEQQKIASFLSAVDEKIQQLSRKKELLEQYKKGVMQQLFSGKLRFKDKNGNDYPDWEEKKLGDVAEFYKGKGISKNEISEDGINECIRYGELYTRYGEIIKDIFSKTNFDISKAVVSKANDVIIPASGETQIDIATASCVMKSGVILGGDLNIIRTNNDGVFLSYYLNNAKKLDIANLAQGISVVHLYSSQLALLNLNLPCLEEQQKIANFLSGIDVKIENTNQQLEQAQRFKKGLLQQMFV